MSSVSIVPIVEGHGEVSAVPVLLRRLFQELRPTTTPVVNPPIRVKAGSFLQDPAYFSRHVSLAAAKAAQNSGLVLILLDCEDECPATLGPDLLARARAVRVDVPCVVALAQREFETWFIAAASSLAGRSGLPADLLPPTAPESIRGAKEWLGSHMPRPYDPVLHQASFASVFSFAAARSVPSFARLADRVLAFAPSDPT